MYQLLDSLAQKLLPYWLYHRLIGSWDKSGFKKYFHNTSWIILARAFSFLVSFFMIAIVARYLGPENLGKLSYAQSFVSIFSIFASLGIDLIVYRDIVARPREENQIIGTAIFAKLIFGLLTFAVTIISAIFINTDQILILLIGIISLNFIFQPFSTVTHIFNARVLSKYSSYGSIAITILLPTLKLLIIFFDKGILFFAGVIALESLLYSIINVAIYRLVLKESPSSWKLHPAIFKQLFKDSWPLMLAGFSGYIYSRIDQVMIQHFIDYTSVGLYEIAVRLTEPLSFLPAIIIGSLFPAVVNAKKINPQLYNKRLKSLTILCLSISFLLVLTMFLLAPLIISILFGDKYTESIKILRIYAWTNLGAVTMSLIYNYFITENKTKAFLFFTVTGASINVLVNLILIPKLGISGAAYATLFTMICLVSIFLLTRKRLLETKILN